jgi:beta-lactamase regulating signal transducer with metallopeptidase domain
MMGLPVVVEIILKTTLLLAAAGVAAFALRSSAASVRHLVWSCALAGMIVIPAMTLVLPQWHVGLIASPEAAPTTELVQADNPMLNVGSDVRAETVSISSGVAPVSQAPALVSTRLTWTTSLIMLWIGGAIAGLITIAGGLLTLRRISRRSRTLTDSDFVALVDATKKSLGIERRVKIIVAEAAAMPATWGVIHPTVMLPADAESWTEERRRIVLLHELAHVKRNDSLLQMLAQVCCAVYWFHPGVWITARKLRSERELACDEHVLAVGINACDYASHLLEIATRFRPPLNTSIAAVAMARPSQLEGRLVAMLSDNAAKRFRSTPRMRFIAVGSLLILSAPLSAMRPWKTPEEIDGDAITSAMKAIPASPADTFRWKGSVPKGKWVEVYADFSDMRAETARGNEVEIQAIRKIGPVESYRIVRENTSTGVKFCLVSAGSNSCDQDVRGSLKNGVPDARADFVIRLPEGVGLGAHVQRGNIEAEVKSYVWATSGRGDIAIVTTDLAEASTDRGSISAEFGRRSWKQNLEFLTDNGDVTVVAPRDANMQVEAVSEAGQVTSEFGGRVSRYRSGQQVMTKAGIGGGALTIHTGRGRAELKKGGDAVAATSVMTVSDNSGSVDPKPNPNFDADTNPDRGVGIDYNPDENPIPEIDKSDETSGSTGERVPVSIPRGLVDRFSNAAISGWPDAKAIARIRDIAATHVKQHENDYVRERSEWALTMVRNGQLIAPMTDALASSDWRVRAYAAWVLGETQDQRAAEALTSALTDQHWRVRMHAAAGLERTGSAAAVPGLLAALNDSSWQVRLSAIDALGVIGDHRAVDRLQTLALRDPHSLVRDEAQGALNRLK